jgi:hypothetical protein
MNLKSTKPALPEGHSARHLKPVNMLPDDVDDLDWDDWQKGQVVVKDNRSAVPFSEYSKPRHSSFTSVLCDLAVGASATKTHTLDEDMALGWLIESLGDMKKVIANNCRPSITQARRKTGFNYGVETSHTLTASGRIFLHVVVTRLEDGMAEGSEESDDL